MLSPRPSGLSLLKILRHEHFLNDLVLVLVVRVLHDFDDVVSGEFGLRWTRRRVVLFLHLGCACSGVVSWNASRTIAAQMSCLFTGEALPCFHQFRSFLCCKLSGPGPVYVHRVWVLGLWAVRLEGLLPLLLRLLSRVDASPF